MGKDLNSVTYGNGRFVAVGELGIVLTSPDGIDWTIKNGDVWQLSDSFPIALSNSIIYAKNRFVAVGEGFLTSIDGEKWTEIDSFRVIQGPGDTIMATHQFRLFKVVCNDSLFVAVGDWGAIMTSPDGRMWTEIAGDLTSQEHLTSVVYGDHNFVAIGYRIADYVTNAMFVKTSPDGIHWTTTDSLASCRISSIAYGNSLYVAVGESRQIMTSKDGSSWTKISHDSSGSDFHYINFINNQFVVAGFNYLTNQSITMTSPDGITWAENDWVGDNLFSATYGDGKFVIVGQAGTIETSPDAKTWTMITKGVTSNLHSVAYGNGMYVVEAGGVILSSPDKTTWTPRQLGENTCNLGQVIFCNNNFIALACSQCTTDMRPVNFFSPDGITWTQNNIDTEVNSAVWDIAYGNGRFCGFGFDSYFSSSDGISWKHEGDVKDLIGEGKGVGSISFCNGQFFAFGNGGAIFTSPDGTIWTKQNSNTTSDLTSVAYGDSQYVVVGHDRTILTSKDGVSWEVITTGSYESFSVTFINSVAYGNGTFVAVSQNLFLSPDGRHWTEKGLNIQHVFNKVIFADSQFIAVGDVGMIMASRDGAKWSFHPESQQTSTAAIPQNPQADHQSALDNSDFTARIKIANTPISKRLPPSFRHGWFSVELFNAMGRKVFSISSAELCQAPTVTIAGTPPGMYILSIKNQNRVCISSRIIITR
jgi:hypothetical protein